MTDDERCIHDLTPATCSFCKGTEPKKEPHVSECHDCGAPVMWVFSERGKAMPIDVESGGSDKARFRKERTEHHDGKVVGIVHFVKDNEIEANTRQLYACHWDNCPARGKGI